MQSYMKPIVKKWQQKGAVLALSALLLPMIVVGTGFAVDLGNIYVQYSRLQNAADAAALAGAHEYADKKDTLVSHGHADKMAKKYINGEYKNLKNDEEIDPPNFQAKSQDKITYYRVKLTREVPLYFLGTFYKKVGGKNTFTVPAESVAGIPMMEESTGGWFKNGMIIFKKSYVDTNSVENWDTIVNPDTTSPSGDVVKDTFDNGRIIYTNGDGTKDSSFKPDFLWRSGQMRSLQKFYTTKAKEDYIKTKDRNILLDKSGEGTYWIQEKYDVYDFDAFMTYMNNKTASAARITDQNYYAKKNTLASVDILRVSSSVPNLNFVVSESLGADKDKPLYVFVEAGPGLVKLVLNADTGRPIIFCIGGNKDKRCQVELDLNGHTFKGVFYAPYCDDTTWWGPPQGVLLKSNGGDSNFMGTLVGSAITIQNYNIHFSYQDYLGSGPEGNSSSGRTEGIKLVSPPDTIIWD